MHVPSCTIEKTLGHCRWLQIRRILNPGNTRDAHGDMEQLCLNYASRAS